MAFLFYRVLRVTRLRVVFDICTFFPLFVSAGRLNRIRFRILLFNLHAFSTFSIHRFIFKVHFTFCFTRLVFQLGLHKKYQCREYILCLFLSCIWKISSINIIMLLFYQFDVLVFVDNLNAFVSASCSTTKKGMLDRRHRQPADILGILV